MLRGIRYFYSVLRRGAPFEAATLLSVLVIALGGWMFLAIADEMRAGDTMTFDVWALRSLRQAGNPAVPIGPIWLPEAARDVTALGGACVLAMMSGIVLGYLCLRRSYRAAAFLLASLAGGALLNASCKAFFARPRPTVVPHLTTFDSASFPSGHSMLSAVAYLTIVVVLARLGHRRVDKLYFLFVGTTLAFLVGLSRIYLGVHYPTDVLAGWVAGITWAIFCSLLAHWLQTAKLIEPPAPTVSPL